MGQYGFLGTGLSCLSCHPFIFSNQLYFIHLHPSFSTAPRCLYPPCTISYLPLTFFLISLCSHYSSMFPSFACLTFCQLCTAVPETWHENDRRERETEDEVWLCPLQSLLLFVSSLSSGKNSVRLPLNHILPQQSYSLDCLQIAY